mmetsp:Transcript_14763/g.37564  ORF Transcript_14763/g.37564 Transcript_14763/m.37564 type:complete len:467 (+) Transcript_14763:172-1572(+)
MELAEASRVVCGGVGLCSTGRTRPNRVHNTGSDNGRDHKRSCNATHDDTDVISLTLCVFHNDCSFLLAIGEIIVSCTKKVCLTRFAGLQKTRAKVGAGIVQLIDTTAVLRLVEVSKGVLGQRDVVNARRVDHGSREQRSDVAAVRLCLSVAVVVARVVVGTTPLNMVVVAHLHVERGRCELVLHTREDLHDVAALAFHVQVVDLGGGQHTFGARTNRKEMRAVLEGAAVLRSVDGQLQRETHSERVHLRVVGEWRLVAVLLGETKLLTLTIVLLVVGTIPRLVVAGGDVVANAEHAVLRVDAGGHLPAVAGHLTVERVTEVVVTRPRGHLALGRLSGRDRRHRGPGAVGERALTRRDRDQLAVAVGQVQRTVVARMEVLRLCEHQRAEGLRLVGQVGNIHPAGGTPVRIVVALLGALETASSSTRILSREARRLALQLLRGGEEALVALGGLAELVPIVVLVHTEA